jgi:NAD(P)-dependent dehydrogenase (short-subunit alcohol dehydrogenase family)
MLNQIVLTGASSELGSYLLNRLSASPANKLIVTMRRSRGEGDIDRNNVRLLDGVDLAHPEATTRVASAVEQEFSGPFALIHSVGDFWDHVPFEDFTGAQAARMFESHVTTLYNTLQSLLPLMRAQGGGSVVTFSCNSVRYNYPWMASFTASKAAVDSLVRSLAYEFAGFGVRLNSLQLASVKTSKVQLSKPHGDFEHFLAPDDIFPVIEFLLSPGSFLVNGNTISLFEHSDSFYNSGYFERISK